MDQALFKYQLHPFLFEQALGQYNLALATQYLVQNILNNKKVTPNLRQP